MKVLFATDFYAASVTARALLLQRPWSSANGLELLHVLTPRPRIGWFAGGARGPEELAAAAGELRSFGRALEAVVEKAGGSLRRTILVGDPARSVNGYAQRMRTDLVVIGGPGRAESAGAAPSDFSFTVATDAPCSVLIARTPRVDTLRGAIDPRGNHDERWAILRAPLFRSLPMNPTGRGGEDLLVIGAHLDARGNEAPDRAIADALTRLSGSLLIARPPLNAVAAEGAPTGTELADATPSGD